MTPRRTAACPTGRTDVAGPESVQARAAKAHKPWRPDDDPFKALAYERPAVIPDHPADVAARRFETGFVCERRSHGVSWANISRMLGKAESDLRRDHGAVL